MHAPAGGRRTRDLSIVSSTIVIRYAPPQREVEGSPTIEAKVHWSRVICKEPGDYIGWPTVARKDDGELLAVFSGDREAHWCPYGKTEVVRSRDGGETWSEPETINNTPLDDRDAGIVVLRSGAIVMSWFTAPTWDNLERRRERVGDQAVDAWRRHCDKIADDVRRRWLGQWTRRSTDGGATWEAEVDSIASAPHGPIELSDGRLLYVGTANLDGRPALASVESTDEGRSWQVIGEMPVPEEDVDDLTYYEPHSVELEGGRIVCLWRYHPKAPPRDDAYMRQTESNDGGKMWSVTHPTPMWGYPPHLVRLHAGILLASYGRRKAPFGQRVCLSHDGGETWDIENELVLRADAANGDLGYPSTVELEPAELLTVYYQIDQPDEKTSLMATRWSVR